MSIELRAKSDFPEVGISNGTWLKMLLTTEIKDIIGKHVTNDLLTVDADSAKKCADALEDWTPPEGWFMLGHEEKGKLIMIEFFKQCEGFTVH